MPPPPFHPAAKRLGGWQRAILIIVGLIILLVLLVAVFIAARHLFLSAKIKTKLAQIRASNEPVTLQELDSYYKGLPLDTNGAALYKQAFTIIKRGGSHEFLQSKEEIPEDTNALPENLRASMAKAVTDSKTAFELLQKAAACGACRFPIDITDGWAALVPHLAELPICGRLELCNGILKEQSGSVDAAIQSVGLICKYADSVNGEPDLISVITQQKMDYQAYELSFWLLNHQNLSGTQLAALQNIFRNREPVRWLDRSIMGDRAATLAMFHYSAADFLSVISPGQTTVSGVFAIRLARFLGQAKLDELTYLRRLDDIRAASRLPVPESFDHIDILTEDIRKEAIARALFATGSILPGLIKGINRNAQHTARLHLIQTALALEQYRGEHKSLPEKLDALKPTDPTILIDPFNAQQLHYDPSGQGYTLYSIGPDRADDGGKNSVPLYSINPHPPGDFTATVRR